MSIPGVVSNPRLVLVLGDGAIRAGFVAGAIGRLVELVPELLANLRIVYGSSAGSGNTLYLLGFDEAHPGEKMWTELLSDERFIRKGSIFSDTPIYDIEYLVEHIFREKMPLPLKNGGVPERVGVIFPALEAGTSNVIYFANKRARELIADVAGGVVAEMEGPDIYRLIGAASAAPFVYDRPFLIDGKKLIDAAALASSINNIHFNEDGLKYLYIFCRKPPNALSYVKYFLNTMFFIACVLPFRKARFPLINYIQYGFKPSVVAKAFEEAFRQQAEGDAVVIYPEASLGSIDDNSNENLTRNYGYGVSAADEFVERVRSLILPVA